MAGTIRKRGKAYHIQYWYKGKQYSKVAGPKKKDAEILLAEINHKINIGTHKEIRVILFKDFVGKWLERQKPILKASSFEKYLSVIRSELLPLYGDVRVDRINTEDIQDWVTTMTDRKLRPATTNTYLTTLRKLMADAVKWNYIRVNPAAAVDRPKMPKTELDYLKPKEIGRLLVALRPNQRDVALISLLAYSGLRVGEALALTWADIDLEAQTINVNKTAHAGVVTAPKTSGSNRVVSFPKVLVVTLMEYKLSCSMNKEDDVVFQSQVGTMMDRNHVRNRILQPALKNADLRRVSVHSLRHSYATIMISQGETMKFIQGQLGHTSMKVTFDRYGHLLPATGQEAMKRFDRFIESEILVAEQWQTDEDDEEK